MLQLAASRMPKRPSALDVPALFLDRRMYTVVHILSLGSVLLEIVIGFQLYRWFGLVIWLPFLAVAHFIFPGKNPGPCFFIGILVVALGAVLLATA